MYKILLLSFEEVDGESFVNPQVNSIREDLSTLGEVTSIGFSKSESSQSDRFDSTFHVAFSNHARHPIIRRLMAILNIINIYMVIIKSRKFDCIYCINFPAMLIGAFSRPLKIYHALEIFGEMSSIPHKLTKIIAFFESIASSRFDAILVPSSARIKYYNRVIGNRNYYMALNSPSILEISSLNIDKLKDERAFRIIYAGGVGPSRDIRPLIQAIARFDKNLDIPVEFHLYTRLSNSSPYYTDIVELAASLNIAIIFKPYLNSRSEFIENLAKYDCSVGVYGGDRQNNLLCAPTKIVDSALAATPWLCSALPGAEDALDCIGGGVLVDTDDVESIYNGLLSISTTDNMFKIDIYKQKMSQIDFISGILSDSRSSK